MNIHSIIMARSTDLDRIERIRKAALELIVKNGYGGAPVSAIAKKAGVAEGYLYRHYKGKQELVADLLKTRIDKIVELLEELMEQGSSTAEIVTTMTSVWFKMARKNSIEIKFIHVLLHDYNFQISQVQREQIFDLCRRALIAGKLQNHIGELITEEEFFYMAVVYPIEFLNMRMKNMFGKKSWDVADEERVRTFILNTLKV